MAQSSRDIHSTRLLLFQRNGTDESVPPGTTPATGGPDWTAAKDDATARISTDEGVPSGAASAAGGANWTVAKEIAAFGGTQLGDTFSVPSAFSAQGQRMFLEFSSVLDPAQGTS